MRSSNRSSSLSQLAVIVWAAAGVATATSATQQQQTERRLLDTSAVDPKSPLLTAEKWITLLSTEVSQDIEGSEELWIEQSKFEYARAIRDATAAGAPYPFVLCDTDSSGADGGVQSGYVRRLRVADAVAAAAAAANITPREKEM